MASHQLGYTKGRMHYSFFMFSKQFLYYKRLYTYQHGIRIQIMSVDDFGRRSYTTKGYIYISTWYKNTNHVRGWLRTTFVYYKRLYLYQYSRWQVTSWGIQKGGCVTVFSCFQNSSYRIIKKGWSVALVDISSVW